MKEYLIPDYYLHFQCKIGDCRTPCCNGWPISLSLNDYFSLTTCDCSKQLRERIDKCVKIKIYPTVDSYAEIIHSYSGKCPFQNDDGKCLIHLEVGENALSDVCRLYPRGIRKTPSPECSCASSCEKVVEMFLEKKEPIKFIKQNLEITEPPYITRNFNFSTMGKEQEIRLYLIKIIQTPNIPLFKRILSLGMSLHKLEIIINNQDENALKDFLSNKFQPSIPDEEVSEKHLLQGIIIIEKLLEILDEKSESLKKYGKMIFEYFTNSENILEKYCEANDKFKSLLTDWERVFEHLLVNHMFFSQFPFQDREESLWDEYVALCSIYSLLRFLSIGFSAIKNNVVEYTDMCAAFFRLVDHTDFDRLSTRILKNLGCYVPQKIYNLVII